MTQTNPCFDVTDVTDLTDVTDVADVTDFQAKRRHPQQQILGRLFGFLASARRRAGWVLCFLLCFCFCCVFVFFCPIYRPSD